VRRARPLCHERKRGRPIINSFATSEVVYGIQTAVKRGEIRETLRPIASYDSVETWKVLMLEFSEAGMRPWGCISFRGFHQGFSRASTETTAGDVPSPFSAVQQCEGEVECVWI